METKKEIINEKDLTTSKREPKVYTLGKGRLPFKENGKVEIPFNYHTLIITKAIDSLRKEGKEKAKREEIMEKAKELDLYKKESKSSPSYIFSWWLKSLKYLGYIVD